jgi:hypothetical protein
MVKKRFLKWVFLFVGLWAIVTGVLAQQNASNTTELPNDLATLITAIRADLDTLADEVLGVGVRPATWSGNGDVSSVSVVADIWYDNEQLADSIFGVGIRPSNWISATTNNAFLVTRNIRHDLELSADQQFGQTRPQNWVGASPIYRCDRTIQNTLYVLQTVYSVQTTTPTTASNFCATIANELDTQVVIALADQNTTVDYAPLILAVRGDLERLADEKLGLNTRPNGWVGNKDIASPNLARDNASDLELLADTFIAGGIITQRPDGWVNANSSVVAVAFQRSRYDLEILTDASLGAGIRPRGWQGTDAVFRCQPTLQNLTMLIQATYNVSPTVDSASATVCVDIASQVNLTAEKPPAIAEGGGSGGGSTAEDDRFLAESRIAFAYLDVAATQYMGQMPLGTEFKAWYRNYNGSNMMFVSGVDFAVFIDRRWTTMSEEVFGGLPTLDGVKPLTFCNTGWCNGPSATPTPTGGVLFDIILGATPPATLPPGANTDSTGKKLVSWNHVRVTYVLQNSSQGKAQVALEICQETTQVTCEPVVSVLNNSTGVQVPVLSVFNGLNVYELAYGYSNTLTLTGTTLFSQDVWLNDPSITGGG